MSGEGAASAGRLERVPIDQIRVYARNPRRAMNPEYDRIKQSIRERGLEQPLIVADGADGAGYVVSAGGNTRLMILKELRAETGDDRFATVECVVRPWESDAAVLIGHLRENDLRGALSFIDRAHAVVELKKLLEAREGKPLAQRQLAARLTQSGYAVSQTLISCMVYAVEILEPLMPAACAGGLARRPIERIRALERAASTVWNAHRLGTKAELTETFATLCRRSDGPDWSFEALRNSVELELASAADARIHTIRLALDQALGDPLGGTAKPPLPDAEAPTIRPRAPDGVETERRNGPEYPETPGVPPAMTNGCAGQSEAAPEPVTELGALRREAWTLAQRLAERYGLGALVIETLDLGIGFTVVDVPDESLTSGLDPETLGRVSLLWWHLVAAAELMVVGPEAVLQALAPSSTLGRILKTGDADALFERVWTPDPGQSGDLLWRALPEPDWRDLLELMRTYRRLHEVATTRGDALWEKHQDKAGG